MEKYISLLNQWLKKQPKKLTINLLDSNKNYSKGKLGVLEYFADNFQNFQNTVKNVDIVVASERIPFNIFSIINKFYTNTKDMLKTRLVVQHINKYNPKKSETIKLWDIETIINANNYINDICENIKRANLSPAEALVYIHLKVSRIVAYKKSAKMNWDSNDQYFTGAFMQTPEFVCAGFASLEKQIIDTLNMPGLECDTLWVTFRKRESVIYEDHLRLLLNLKDDKYNISGHYFSDPTWDNSSKDCPLKYSHLLLPNTYHDYGDSKYDYDSRAYIIRETEQSEKSYINVYLDYAFCNEERNLINQDVLEKIVFSAMAKTTSKSFDSLYKAMEKMAKDTNVEQDSREYDYLESPKLHLSKRQAKTIYENANQVQNEI